MKENNLWINIYENIVKSPITFFKDNKLFCLSLLIANAMVIKVGLEVDRLVRFNFLAVVIFLFIILTVIECCTEINKSRATGILLGLYYTNACIFMFFYIIDNAITTTNTYITIAKIIFYCIIIAYLPIVVRKINTKYNKAKILTLPTCFILVLLTTMQFFSLREKKDGEIWFDKDGNGTMPEYRTIYHIPFLQKTNFFYTIIPELPVKKMEVELKIILNESTDNKWQGELNFKGDVLVSIKPYNIDAYKKIQYINLKPLKIKTTLKDETYVGLIEQDIYIQTDLDSEDIKITLSGI